MALDKDLMQFAKNKLAKKYRSLKIPRILLEKSGYQRALNTHLAQIAGQISEVIQDGIEQEESENKLKDEILDIINKKAFSQSFLDSIEDTSGSMTLDEIIEALGIDDDDDSIEKLTSIFPGKDRDDLISAEDISLKIKELNALKQKKRNNTQLKRKRTDYSTQTKSIWHKTFVQMFLGILNKEIANNSSLKKYFSFDPVTRSAITSLSSLDKIITVTGSDIDPEMGTPTTSFKVSITLQGKSGFFRTVKSLTIVLHIDFKEKRIRSEKPSYKVTVNRLSSEDYFIPTRKLESESPDLLDLSSEIVDDILLPTLIFLQNKGVFKDL